ncbi:hypothetical protein CC80DRAFT_549848 [Byssothecium circinans]|uniref:Uncharacterized protein n=1 Tax=Byssothecium circinans TaxID=147558 RepID=A0A6A5TT22_9PLEO|nr:hypothetical protein CC80DRAFT_549848 [Byssothecium circinans]
MASTSASMSHTPGTSSPTEAKAPEPQRPLPIPETRQNTPRGGSNSFSESSNVCLTIEQVCSHNVLWYKLHVFMYDLRNFRSSDEARARLDCIADEHYLGQPYFTREEA